MEVSSKCMTDIGAKPSAKDPLALVYEAKYNFDSEDEDDKWKVLKHDAEVRLMRYRELIEAMSAKGIKAGEDWVLRARYDDGYEGGTDRCEETLPLDQMLAFAQAMSYGLYYYTNFDNLYPDGRISAHMCTYLRLCIILVARSKDHVYFGASTSIIIIIIIISKLLCTSSLNLNLF